MISMVALEVSRDADFDIRDVDDRRLAVEGSILHKPSIHKTKLKVAWTGITWTMQELHATRIHITENSSIINGWIQDRIEQHHVHSLPSIIFSDLLDCH